ncbi:hypothetical protein ACX80I_12625 [Arthrobacter sp. MDT3-44]
MTVLDEIYANIPGYKEAQNLHEGLRTYMTKRNADTENPGVLQGEAISDLIKAAAAGKDLEPVFKKLREAEARRLNKAAEVTVLHRAVQQTATQFDTFKESVIDEVLEGISERLEAATTRLAALENVPATAEQAIAANKVDVWQEAQKLTADIDALVAAYGTVSRPFLANNFLPTVKLGAFFKDPAAVDPEMVTVRHQSSLTAMRSGQAGPVLADWYTAVPASSYRQILGGDIVPQGADKTQWYKELATAGQFTVRHPEDAVAVVQAAERAVQMNGIGSNAGAWEDISAYLQAIGDTDAAQHAEDQLAAYLHKGARKVRKAA